MAPLIDTGDELRDGSRRRVPAGGIIHGRHELFGDFLAELHSPLIEGVDAPHDTLCEHAVLVESNDPAESSRIELPEEHDGERSAAGIGRVITGLSPRISTRSTSRSSSGLRLRGR